MFGINGVGWFHYRDAPDGPRLAQRRIDDVKALGAAWDRLDFWWSVIEPRQGRWNWSLPDRVVALYAKNGVRPLPILSYASAWSDGAAPSGDAERTRFARYVEAVVRRYRRHVRAWEVWNEPNIPTFWSPHPDAKAYAALLKVAYRAAKRADPTCTVAGGATSMADLNFLHEMIRHGAWDSMDVVSIHPYSMAGGPTFQRLDLILESVRKLNRSTKHPKPIWITEMGWTADNPGEDGDQGRFLVQSYALALAFGVERLFWFNLQDWSEKWGLTRVDHSRKAGFLACRTASRMLSGARFRGYARSAPDWRRYHLVFERSRRPLLVLWQEVSSRPERFPLARKPARIIDAFGYERPERWRSGAISVDRTPLFVIGAEPAIVRNAMKRRPLDPRQNLLANAAMEGDGPTPWGWDRGRHEGTGRDGQFRRVESGDTRWLELFRSKDAAWDHVPLPVEPGQRYRLTVRVQSEGATGRNIASIYWWNAVGWGYRGQSDTESILGTTGRTRTESRVVEAVAPDGAYYARVNLVSRENEGAVRFSRPELIRLDP